MNKLSKREKNMLIALGIIAVVGVLFTLVVKPIMDTASTNKAIITELEIKLQEAEAAVAMRPDIEKRLKVATEFIKSEELAYYTPMHNWETERRVAKWLYDNNVVYHSVSIVNPHTFQMPAENGKQVDPNADIPPNGVEESTVIVECQTTPEKFHNLLNTLYNIDRKAVISSWEWEGMEYKVAEGVQMPEDAPTIKAIVKFKLFTSVE